MHTTNEMTTDNSLVTVGIVTFNSSRTLPHTLESLRTQTLPADLWNVVFIDHNSNDSTKQQIESFLAGFPRGVLFEKSENNLALSRQHILLSSRTRWLAYVDSDVVLPSHWLEQALRHAESQSSNPRFAGVCGPLHLRPLNRALATVGMMQRRFLGHVLTEQMYLSPQPRRAEHLPTSAAFFLRELVIKAGGFLAEMENCGEDLELGLRLNSMNLEQYVLPELAVLHLLSCTTPSEWLKRAFRFGRTRIRVATVHRQLWVQPLVAFPIALAGVQCLSLICFTWRYLWSMSHQALLTGQTDAHRLAAEFWIHVFGETVGLHLMVCCAGYFLPRRPILGFKTGLITWATHQAYAWGELYEVFKMATDAFVKPAKAAAQNRSRRVFRWADWLKNMALH